MFFSLGRGREEAEGKNQVSLPPQLFLLLSLRTKRKVLESTKERRRRRRRKEREEGGGVLNGAEGIERREGSPGGLKGVQIETKWAPNGLLLSATAPPLPPTPTPLLGPPTSIRPSALPSAAVNARAQS